MSEGTAHDDVEADEQAPKGTHGSTRRRTVVRWPASTLDAIDSRVRKLRAQNPGRAVSRSAVIVALTQRGLAADGSVEIPRMTHGPRVRRAEGASLRAKILRAINLRAGEVLTPGRLVPLLGARNTDAVRNALLVLADKGQIEKVGLGQYTALTGTARAPEPPPAAAQPPAPTLLSMPAVEQPGGAQ